MPNYRKETTDAQGVQWDYDFKDWRHSKRINGKLVLAENPYSRDQRRIIDRSSFNGGDALLRKVPLLGTHTNWFGKANENAAYNKCYARLRGKLYKGSASLGVTAGSWRQSREMIVKRYGQLNNKADKVLADLVANRIKTPADVAGFHLEVIFGWVPLLADIQAATRTVIQLGVPPVHVRARETYTDYMYRKSGLNIDIGKIDGGVHLQTNVRISNPNLWLAERAGSLNAAAVVWDLVPWSFVVNMFVNTGQLVNSVTDFAGLEFSNVSRTDFEKGFYTEIRQQVDQGQLRGGHQDYFCLREHRSITGSIPRPTFQFKIPGVNWELAAMAASLFTQKFGTINNLLKRFN